MPNGYWNAHSDRDWEDQCGMFEEPSPEGEEEWPDAEEEYSPLELLEVHARVWDAVLDVLFGGGR